MDFGLIEYSEDEENIPLLWVGNYGFQLKDILTKDYGIVSENIILFINELKKLSSDILNEKEIIDKRIDEIEYHSLLKHHYNYFKIFLNSIFIKNNEFQEKLDKIFYLLSNIAQSSIKLDKYIEEQNINNELLNKQLLELSQLYSTSYTNLYNLFKGHIFINELYYDIYDIDYDTKKGAFLIE